MAAIFSMTPFTFDSNFTSIVIVCHLLATLPSVSQFLFHLSILLNYRMGFSLRDRGNTAHFAVCEVNDMHRDQSQTNSERSDRIGHWYYTHLLSMYLCSDLWTGLLAVQTVLYATPHR